MPAAQGHEQERRLRACSQRRRRRARGPWASGPSSQAGPSCGRLETPAKQLRRICEPAKRDAREERPASASPRRPRRRPRLVALRRRARTPPSRAARAAAWSSAASAGRAAGRAPCACAARGLRCRGAAAGPIRAATASSRAGRRWRSRRRPSRACSGSRAPRPAGDRVGLGTSGALAKRLLIDSSMAASDPLESCAGRAARLLRTDATR